MIRLIPEYEQFNNNTDWRKEVKQFGLFQTHYVSLSGGGEKANYRLSAGYDHQVGSIIAQKLDRFTTRMALDYFVNDRITISSDFALTYTDNKKNSDDLLKVAYMKMPNAAIYDEMLMAIPWVHITRFPGLWNAIRMTKTNWTHSARL